MSRRHCWQKRRYASLDMARKQREFSRRRACRPLRIYLCDHCDGWHLTKQVSKVWP